MPYIDAPYPMAWQQKGSDHQFNLQSGHGSLFGHSRKIIGMVIKSKLCNLCTLVKKKNPEDTNIPEHCCRKNHDGSSGSMESRDTINHFVEAFKKGMLLSSNSVAMMTGPSTPIASGAMPITSKTATLIWFPK